MIKLYLKNVLDHNHIAPRAQSFKSFKFLSYKSNRLNFDEHILFTNFSPSNHTCASQLNQCVPELYPFGSWVQTLPETILFIFFGDYFFLQNYFYFGFSLTFIDQHLRHFPSTNNCICLSFHYIK
jgi:hypothetical protein